MKEVKQTGMVKGFWCWNCRKGNGGRICCSSGGKEERSWKLPRRGVARAESGKTNEYSVAEEVMCVAKGTEAGDSRPDVGESLGVGMRAGKTEGRGFRGGQAQIMP